MIKTFISNVYSRDARDRGYDGAKSEAIKAASHFHLMPSPSAFPKNNGPERPGETLNRK
jgi:hypothetical protein